MAGLKKVVLSIPDSLLSEADGLAAACNITRDELVNEAVALYLREKRRKQIRQQLASGYRKMAEINSNISEMCLEADNQALELYESKLAECE